MKGISRPIPDDHLVYKPPPREGPAAFLATHLEITKPLPHEPACSVKPIPLVSIHHVAYSGPTLTSTPDTLFWDIVFSMDITSTEGLSTIAALLHSPSKIIEARNLRGDQARRLIDLLDLVSNSGKRPSVPRALTTRHSFSRCHALTRGYPDGLHNCFTSFVDPAGCYPPHMLFVRSSAMLVSLNGQVASQM